MESETVEIGSEVKERPILFSGEMVRAILDGRKTQTRRVMKPQPDPSTTHFGVLNGVEHWACNGDPRDIDSVGISDDRSWACPYGVPGDRLWVREAFYIDHQDAQRGPLPKVMPPEWADMIYYRADGECCDQIAECQCWDVGKPRWRPSMFMPRWASRLLLVNTEVRVERLQEIKGGDGKAEGYASCADFIDRSAWCREHWDANPWVWAVTFKIEKTRRITGRVERYECSPIRWNLLAPDPIYVLLSHSDCDGEISVHDLPGLAQRLGEIADAERARDDGGGSMGMAELCEKFANGCRAAIKAGENVEFH